MRLRVRHAIVLAAAIALAVPAAALGFDQVRAVFFKEYSKPVYSVDQGELLTFVNGDPFFDHGVRSLDTGPGGKPLFSAPVVARGHKRLLRGAPFLTAGSYDFRCQLHPRMTATLEVTPAGSPLPPDLEPPGAGLGLRVPVFAARLAAKRRIMVTVNPVEAAEVVLSVRVSGTEIARAERTYLVPGRRVLTMVVTKAGRRALRTRIARLRGRGVRRLGLKLNVWLTDVAGNRARLERLRRLRLPLPPGSMMR